MNNAEKPSSKVGRLVGGLLAIGGLLTIGLIIVAFMESGVRAATDSPSQCGPGPDIPADTLITGTVSDERGPVSGTRVQVSVSLDFDLAAMVATERSDGDRQKWPLVAW